MKPWYCKTEGLTDKQIADFFDLAVENGANLLVGVDGMHSSCDDQQSPNEWSFFGVDDLVDTVFWYSAENFGVDAIELKPNEIKSFILGRRASLTNISLKPGDSINITYVNGELELTIEPKGIDFGTEIDLNVCGTTFCLAKTMVDDNGK